MRQTTRALGPCVGCAAFEARIETLERRLAALEACRPLAASDWPLRRALADSTAGHTFTTTELLRHGVQAPALRQALADAMIDTPGELGMFLARRIGTRDGITIRRGRRRLWQVLYTSDTSPVAGVDGLR